MSRWTADQKALLSRLWPTDTPVLEIAARVGKNKDTVYHQAAKMSLERPVKATSDITPAQEVVFRKLWADFSITKAEIAKQMDESYTRIDYWGRKLQMPRRPTSRRKPGAIFLWPVTPWPDDMPRFDDDPVEAGRPFNRTLAIRVGAMGMG